MFLVTFTLSSANTFNLGKPKILSSGKGLRDGVHGNQLIYIFYEFRVHLTLLLNSKIFWAKIANVVELGPERTKDTKR